MKSCGKKRSAGIGVLLLGMVIMLPVSSPAQSQIAQDYFTAGMGAARQGDHSSALQQFKKALTAGMHSAALYYNIGVTYYRLGYPKEAASAFERSARSPKMAALAYYNLGLIALDQDDRPLARDYFRQAEQQARTENLRKLSHHALETMRPDKDTATGGNEPDSGRGLLWVEFSTGYDDNVLLLQPEVSIASGEDDTLAGIMLFGHYYVAGNHRRGLRLYALTLDDRHSNLDSFDLGIRAAGADYALTIRQWHHSLDVMLLQTSLGGDGLEDTGRFTFSSDTLLTDNLQLKLQFGYEAINAASAYSFLDGNRRTGGIALSEKAGNWQLEYNLEFNNREDYLAEDGEFQSFSPRRRELVFTRQIGFGNAWMLELEGTYMQSRYRDENIQPDGARQKREDKRPTLAIGIYKTWLHDWRLGAELRYMENESNLDDFDYTRHAFTLTLDKAFRF